MTHSSRQQNLSTRLTPMRNLPVRVGRLGVLPVALLVLFLCAVSMIAWLSLLQIERGVREDVGSTLDTIVRTTHESLEIWIADRKDYVDRLAAAPELRHLVRLQLALPRTRAALLDATSTTELREFFERNRDHYGHTGFFIIAPDHVNVASMRDAKIGVANLIAAQRGEVLERAFAGETVLVPPVRSDVPLPAGDGELAVDAPTMFIASPVRTDSGEVLAVLSIRLAPEDDFSRITQLGRVGGSGETYAFDENGMMLTQSRFTESLHHIKVIAANQSGILGIRVSDPGGNLYEGFVPGVPQDQRPLTVMARDAVAGNTGINTAGYRDYRGVPVLGAWTWDSTLGIGLATEIDEAEAMASFRETRATIVAVLVVTVVLTMLLLFALTRIMQRANDALRAARDELGLRVEQRTSEIQTAHRLLDDIFRSTPDAVLGVNSDGAIIQANPQAERLFGYSREELLGLTVEQLLPESMRARHRELREGYFANPTMRSMAEPRDVTAWHRSGRQFPVEISLGYTMRDEEVQVVATVRDISARHEAAEALRESEARIRQLLESIDEGMFGVDLQGRCTFVNPAALRLLGYSKVDELVGQPMHQLIHHTRRDGTLCPDEECRVHRAFREHRSFYADDEVLWRADGTPFDAEYRSNPLSTRGEMTGAVVTFTDISQRKRAEAELMQAATVFENTDEGIIVTDGQRRIVAVNQAFTRISGYSRDDAMGRTPALQNSGRHDDAFYEAMWASLEQTGNWRGEIWNRRKNGEIYPAWENITAIRNASGEVSNYVSVFSDISVIKESEQRLSYLAHHDALTGLPNRLLFKANLDQALEQSRRRDHKVAVLFLDLDRFKIINDTLGHETGDQMLQEVARRLHSCVRREDTVARLGGDEFTIVLAQVNHSEDAALLAEKLIENVSKPLRIGDREILATTSIGISISPDDASSSTDLLKAADTAMYHAKNKGRNNFQFYTPELTERAMDHLALEHDLRIALRDDQLLLYYQPQVDLRTDRIAGVEALIRWQHPRRGLLLPDTFIHVAEEAGLIDGLSEWALRRACRDTALWRTETYPGPKLAVNISGRQIFSETSLQTLESVLKEVTRAPCALQLDLEITEHELQHAEPGLGILSRLRKLGVMLAVDDFGTGYSSLSRLRQLPIDSLKIDRSFISDVPGNVDDEAIVTTIIAMGQSLNLQVVAEGVENQAQLEFLRSHGCHEAQGYLLGEPMPPQELARLLAQQNGAPHGVSGAASAP